MSKIFKGTIMSIFGTLNSNIAILEINDERRGRVNILCENAKTVRTFDKAFGGVIGERHTFRDETIRGKEIYYSVDDLDVLEAFTPVEEAPPELVAEYEKAWRNEVEAKKRNKKGGVTYLGWLGPEDPIYSLGPIVAGRRIFNSSKKFH